MKKGAKVVKNGKKLKNFVKKGQNYGSAEKKKWEKLGSSTA
jgi:hypothetical protein